MKNYFKNKKGFTLIELLVVISIISLLSAIVLTSVSNAKLKARDAIRKQDMQTIFGMLQQYELEFGGIPANSGGASGETGGWDWSSMPLANPNFLAFLVSSGITTKVPIDPLNNKTSESYDTGYSYKYYCYPTIGLSLGYVSEMTKSTYYFPYEKYPHIKCP